VGKRNRERLGSVIHRIRVSYKKKRRKKRERLAVVTYSVELNGDLSDLHGESVLVLLELGGLGLHLLGNVGQLGDAGVRAASATVRG
jgi:hypothetical protein